MTHCANIFCQEAFQVKLQSWIPFCQEGLLSQLHIVSMQATLLPSVFQRAKTQPFVKTCFFPSAQGVPQGASFLLAQVVIFQPCFDATNRLLVLQCSHSAVLDYRVKLLVTFMALVDVTLLWVLGMDNPALVRLSSGRGSFLPGSFFKTFAKFFFVLGIVLLLFLFHLLPCPSPITVTRCARWLDSFQDGSDLEPSLLLRKLGWARSFAKAGGSSCEPTAHLLSRVCFWGPPLPMYLATCGNHRLSALQLLSSAHPSNFLLKSASTCKSHLQSVLEFLPVRSKAMEGGNCSPI